MKNSEKWTYNISTEYVEELNNISYHENDYVFYSFEDSIYYDNGYKSDTFLEGTANYNEYLSFSELDIQEKVNHISVRLDSYNNINQVNLDAPAFTLYGYTPTLTGATCQLYNPQGQGNYNLCWAACIATIANYRNGTSLTATQVADDANISYSIGATLSESLASLQSYGMTKYTSVNSQITWANVYKNIIEHKRPIWVGATASTSSGITLGHAVVCFGCKELNSNFYITLWNPGTNDGEGSSTIVRFLGTGTQFAYANYTWTWTSTLSRYN